MKLLSDRFAQPAPVEKPFPVNVWVGMDGHYYSSCCVCDNPTEIECELDEVDDDTRFWCGRSPPLLSII